MNPWFEIFLLLFTRDFYVLFGALWLSDWIPAQGRYDIGSGRDDIWAVPFRRS